MLEWLQHGTMLLNFHFAHEWWILLAATTPWKGPLQQYGCCPFVRFWPHQGYGISTTPLLFWIPAATYCSGKTILVSPITFGTIYCDMCGRLSVIRTSRFFLGHHTKMGYLQVPPWTLWYDKLSCFCCQQNSAWWNITHQAYCCQITEFLEGVLKASSLDVSWWGRVDGIVWGDTRIIHKNWLTFLLYKSDFCMCFVICVYEITFLLFNYFTFWRDHNPDAGLWSQVKKAQHIKYAMDSSQMDSDDESDQFSTGSNGSSLVLHMLLKLIIWICI
jgi:hypothetical protein